MKNVVVYLNLALNAEAPLLQDDYVQSYYELSEEIKKNGGQMFLVGNMGTYLGNSSFSRSWQYSSSNTFVQTGNVKGDIVFNRGNFQTGESIRIFNAPYVDEICTDKWKTFNSFQAICPDTYLANTKEDTVQAFTKIKTDLIVVKPRYGRKGEGVIIDSKNNALSQIDEESFPLVIQEFMDSSAGISNIVEGTHDLRVAVFSGEIIYSYWRTPPPGSFKANVAQGGTFAMVEVSKLPHDLLDLISLVDKHFSSFPERFYGIDVARTASGYKLIELNSKLGLLPNRDATEFLNLKRKLGRTLVSLDF